MRENKADKMYAAKIFKKGACTRNYNILSMKCMAIHTRLINWDWLIRYYIILKWFISIWFYFIGDNEDIDIICIYMNLSVLTAPIVSSCRKSFSFSGSCLNLFRGERVLIMDQSINSRCKYRILISARFEINILQLTLSDVSTCFDNWYLNTWEFSEIIDGSLSLFMDLVM